MSPNSAAVPKRTMMDRMTDVINKMAEPLIKLADRPSISSVQNGLVSTVPIIIVGSVFLILYVLGSPTSISMHGHAVLPFLTPYADKFVLMNSLTLGIMALYASVTISTHYAERLGVDVKTAATLGLATFIIFTTNSVAQGKIDSTAFGATGLFVAILTSILSVRIYKMLVDRKITIKLPDSVPPSVGNAFTALVPFLVIFTLAWTVRTLIGFDMVGWLGRALGPIITGSDNIGVYVLGRFLESLLWSVGLHGTNMLLPIFQPLQQAWSEQNAAALAHGVNPMNLPHVWTLYGIDRITYWPSTVWPLLVLMFMSKVKAHKALAAAATPAALFTIVEPVIYGLPLALNPYLLIPFILTSVVGGAFSYLVVQAHLVARFYAVMPWATPPFISGPLGTGDWKTILLVAANFAIGFVIYLPFFKIYERHELELEAAREADEAREAMEGGAA